MKNRSHTITAHVEIPKGGANGVILAQAGRFGGWSLYLRNGKPTYTYTFLGLQLLVDSLTGADGYGAVLLLARPEGDPVPALRELAAGIRLPGDQ